MSHDLVISAHNLLRDRDEPMDITQNINGAAVTELVKTMQDILNKEEQLVEVDDTHAYQIKEYLTLINLIMEVDLLHLPDINNREEITVISQPGLRYDQADALIRSLLFDEKFNALSVTQRNCILERILSEVKGRMMEESSFLKQSLPTPKSRSLTCNLRWVNLIWSCMITLHLPAKFMRSSTARKSWRVSTGI